MPKYFREAIIEVAKFFKNYDFIWKVDQGDAIEGVPNLHTFSWVTQAAILDSCLQHVLPLLRSLSATLSGQSVWRL
ncbi:hypothetical protein TELCIR_03873 [Teladorsagia circumcincta]|uniref:Uncharacterized protein n=1 Tax=Teladorsagia circumcincta TaxID=45464 RepID=A0A2G9UV47_TELCI|nr:hypothetical protein TELCIR_03873 [Teladorsagia circumcincta]